MIILEGTDAIGKTSVVNSLKNYELLDRDKNISKIMDFNLSLMKRVKKLQRYIESTENYIIFLVNDDKRELEKRINQQKKIDKYDKYTYLYNLLYLETYLYMEQNNLLNKKLFMIDCTGLSLEEEIMAVKNMIDKNMLKTK